jgi:FtsP/CotA-like multicopper oxidase with cupredoxin domain
MMLGTAGFVVLLFLAVSSHAKDVYYEWELDAVLEDALSPDCMNVKQARRHLFLANRSLPGPLIDVEEGDTVHVSYRN